MMINNTIDFVITWVDGNDPDWQKEKEKYAIKKNGDSRACRYRDWEILKYLFRGIEKYTPWVRKIHFVTCGHVPRWLNIEHTKINIVKHLDFIPKKYLPTFNSNTIVLNLHRIPSIADQFVYFNDDMFILKKLKKEDFFKKGFPCDAAVLNAYYFTLKKDGTIGYVNPVYNTSVINKHFNKKQVIRNSILKWINPKYGFQCFRTILLLPWDKFTGFMNYHLPAAYKKETYENLWKLEGQLFSKTCLNKFRCKEDITEWVFLYWQLVSGSFVPRNPNIGKAYHLRDDCIYIIKDVCSAIERQKYKMVCVNDVMVDEANFLHCKRLLIERFNKVLPEKSAFEK